MPTHYLYELPDGSPIRVSSNLEPLLRHYPGNGSGPRCTDGSPDGYLVPAPHRMVKHPRSGRLFWLRDARELHRGQPPARRSWLSRRFDALFGEAAPVDLGKLWYAAPEAHPPRLHDLQQALDTGMADRRSRALTLRLRLWWGWSARPRSERPSAWTDNLRELLALLPETSDGGTLLKVEVCRQIGDFKAARHWLDWPVTARLEQLRDFQRDLITQGDTARHECSFCFEPAAKPSQQRRRRRRSSSH
jgi:hypothetical protein